MAMSFDARRKALALARKNADKAAKAAAEAEKRRKDAAAKEKSLRDALILDAARELFPGIDGADDPLAFMQESMAAANEDAVSSGASDVDDGDIGDVFSSDGDHENGETHAPGIAFPV